MSETIHGTVTAILIRARSGDRDCLRELIPLVYADLRRIAASALRGERPGHPVQPTALVHEAYLRLADQPGIQWQDRAHFFAIAVREMRRTLVDHARREGARKRGGEWHRVTFAEGDAVARAMTFDLIALDDALEELAGLNARHHQVVELRFFGGMTHKEVAHVLGLSEETIKKDWQFARAWLCRKLRSTG